MQLGHMSPAGKGMPPGGLMLLSPEWVVCLAGWRFDYGLHIHGCDADMVTLGPGN